MAHGSQGTHSRRNRKLTVGIVYCREVAGLDDSLSSCMRQVEERYRVEVMEELGGDVQGEGLGKE